MECYTYLRKVTDLLSDGKTPYERRFGQTFNGPIIPFGSLVEYHPITAKDQTRIHQFGKKVLPGLFLGYALYAGGIWKGDIMVADIEELEQMDASEIHAKRLNAKDMLLRKNGEKLIFPIADGTVKLSGGDQRLRTSSLIWDRPDGGEEQGNLPGESDGSSSTPFQDSSVYDGEAWNDFWSISGNFIYRHHVEPRVKLSLFHSDGFSWSGRRLTTKQTTSRPDTLWPEMWKDISDASKRKEKQKWAVQKPKLDNARKLLGIYFIDPADDEVKEILKMRVESWKFRCQQQCHAEPNAKSTEKPVASWIM